MTATPEDDSFPPFDLAALAGAWQPVPVCWKILDHDAAAREWAAMAEWVRWLATRYTLAPRTIPPCWYRHGALIEELSALRTGWLAAFAPDAPGSAPLDWHTMFAATRNRLDETVSRGGCTKDDHRDDQIATWLTTPDSSFTDAIEEDLSSRDQTPAPPAWN
jgi:hypothetical protein